MANGDSCGNRDRVCSTMRNIDLWAGAILQFKVASAYERGDCPCCKHHRYGFLEGSAGSSADALCGRDAVQLTHRQQQSSLDLEAIAARLRRHGKVVANQFLLRASITDNGRPCELTLFPDGRAIVKGTGEANVARSVYAKYVGT